MGWAMRPIFSHGYARFSLRALNETRTALMDCALAYLDGPLTAAGL